MHFDDVGSNKNPLYYENNFIDFLNLKDFLFYFPTKIPKENNGITAPVYRASIHNSTEFIEDIDQLSYRLASKVNTFGRVNRPCQTYFYASGEAETCCSEFNKRIISELEKKDEISITIGQWSLQRDLTLCVIPDWNNKEMRPFIEKIESFQKLSQKNLNLLKQINELFLKEDDGSNIHQITSAFCNTIVYDAAIQNLYFDGFLYTSVKNGIGFNLALLPHLIDNKDLTLTNVCKTTFFKKGIEYKELGNKPYIIAKSVDLLASKIIW